MRAFAEAGRTKAIDLLMKRGAGSDFVSSGGVSVLKTATINRRSAAMKRLLAARVEPEMRKIFESHFRARQERSNHERAAVKRVWTAQ
jgi:hypothetical protein